MRTVIKAPTLAVCLETMAQYAQAFEQNGGKNLIFCEDRLTLLAERALLKRMGGSFRSSVVTFARFVKAEGKTISKQGSVMAVGEIMTSLQRQEKLQCFTSVVGVGSNAQCIYETLAQMSASEVSPALLRESLALLPEDMLKKKVSDLALIYEAYEAFLAENGFLDESKYLRLLPKKIREEGALKGYNVFFLGYNAFTAQAKETVRAALETADSVMGIFCGGEEEIYHNGAANGFIAVCEEYGKVAVRTEKSTLCGAAERLRKGLFNPEKQAREQSGQVRVFEANDRALETEYVAMKIRREMAENPAFRYRDFALLVPSVSGYSLALKKALSEYKIPYFIDEKKSLKCHPLSKFLLDCFRVVREKFTSAAVQSLTQNVFFGESDEYRNYLLKFANYRGGAKRQIKAGAAVEKLFCVSVLEEGRQRLMTATKEIKDEDSGKNYCAAVRKICAEFEIEKGLLALEQGLDDLSQKEYLAQISGALERVLAEAELLTGEKKLTVAEFEAILKDGLSATEISLIPVKYDAVFIGDIADSRIESAAVVFALGMTEEVPRCAVDTALISDKEIARLAAVKSQLEPTVAEVNLRSRESVCLNLCAFTDKLYLSYALPADGNEPSLSEIFRYIDGLFGVGKDGKIVRSKKDDEEDFIYRCSAPTPAIRQLLLEKNNFEGKREDSRRAYSSLFTALDKLGVEEKKDYLSEGAKIESVARGEELFFKDGTVSPTAMEEYFECPFSHFVKRGLSLQEREETAVMAMDSGNFIHSLLQKSAPLMAASKTEDEMREKAVGLGRELLKQSVYEMQQDTESGSYYLEKLLNEGADVVVGAYRQLVNSDFVIEATEKEVASDVFHGKVDRVDGAKDYVRIIDYKTGEIDDSATSYYTGRKMQMQLYMSKLKGARIPAGVFYFPASVGYSDENEGRFRMKGFLNGDPQALLCGDKNLTADKKSEYFPAALENKAQTKRVMDEQTFRDFLDYAVFAARQSSKELKEGYVAATPYEDACKYCKFGGMCGFSKDCAKPRKEPAIEPAGIAKIAKKIRDGED